MLILLYFTIAFKCAFPYIFVSSWSSSLVSGINVYIIKAPLAIARGAFTHRCCPSVRSSVCLSAKFVHKTQSAILKIAKSPYINENSSDFDEIGYTTAHLEVDDSVVVNNVDVRTNSIKSMFYIRYLKTWQKKPFLYSTLSKSTRLHNVNYRYYWGSRVLK